MDFNNGNSPKDDGTGGYFVLLLYDRGNLEPLRAAVCKYRPGVGKIKISKNPKKIQWTTLGTLVMKI